MSRKMPVIFLGTLLASCGAVPLWAQEKTPESAKSIVDAAVTQAAAEDKVVFIHSTASW
ncbi:MAG: hypothetical protein H6Q05_2409 [Acidobacteria bacterium]|nr:hypothetical protein [Acidobacteriota bacterium]